VDSPTTENELPHKGQLEADPTHDQRRTLDEKKSDEIIRHFFHANKKEPMEVPYAIAFQEPFTHFALKNGRTQIVSAPGSISRPGHGQSSHNPPVESYTSDGSNFSPGINLTPTISRLLFGCRIFSIKPTGEFIFLLSHLIKCASRDF